MRLRVHDYGARENAAAMALPANGAAAVWIISLAELPSADEAARAILSGEERRRAERLAHPFVRDRYIRLHALLRRLASASLGIPGESLRLAWGPHGKPAFADPPAARRLAFGLAHSGEKALIGFIRDGAIGVDIERKRRGVDALGIARRFFAPQEAAELAARAVAGEEGLREAFFRCWTRKEAYVKARGEGLAESFRRFRVSTGVDDPRLEGDERDPLAPGRWRLEDVEIDAAYAAACAFAPVGADHAPCRNERHVRQGEIGAEGNENSLRHGLE